MDEFRSFGKKIYTWHLIRDVTEKMDGDLGEGKFLDLGHKKLNLCAKGYLYFYQS